MGLPLRFALLAWFLTRLGAMEAGAAITNIVQLGDLPQATCGAPFIHAGSILVLTNSALGQGAEGYCSFDAFATGLALYPGNLQVDLSQYFAGLERVEVDFQDACGRGCSKIILALGSVVVAKTSNPAAGEGTLTLPVIPGSVDKLFLSSFEGSFFQIRLVSQAVPLSPVLQAKWSGPELVLTWPASEASCQLKSANPINSQAPWTPVPNLPITTPEGFEVRLIPRDSATFFRLECP